jgi:hypothetical protein
MPAAAAAPADYRIGIPLGQGCLRQQSGAPADGAEQRPIRIVGEACVRSMMAGGCSFMAWPQDAARRNAADFVSASVFSGERITIRAGRAALNPPLIIAGILGRIPPRPVVNHWAFDAEELPVEIGNDEEERWGLFGHGTFTHLSPACSVSLSFEKLIAILNLPPIHLPSGGGIGLGDEHPKSTAMHTAADKRRRRR